MISISGLMGSHPMINREVRRRMLRIWSRFDQLEIGFPVTVMIPNTDLKYLTQEQITKVCEGAGSPVEASYD